MQTTELFQKHLVPSLADHAIVHYIGYELWRNISNQDFSRCSEERVFLVIQLGINKDIEVFIIIRVPELGDIMVLRLSGSPLTLAFADDIRYNVKYVIGHSGLLAILQQSRIIAVAVLT